MANRLASALSPYLAQHADNPVDWWEWGDDAFDAARERDVPLFISIGYAACHWCHVMAHESFEDPVTAQLLNERFVSIKVDREERPDVDAVYMDATVALTGHGGWPMSVFVDHDGRPFYAGTYFPPADRHGLPAFRTLLVAVSDAWRERRAEVTQSAARIVDALAQNRAAVGRDREAVPGRDELDAAAALLAADYDVAHGGFGGAPKFPPHLALGFLLDHAALTGDDASLAVAAGTLNAMARGGIYDQLGRGFARYSVDRAWIVPHFERMLTDNALLLRVYAQWFRLAGSPLAERITREVAAFLIEDLRTAEGGFAASFDADTIDGEGAYACWSPASLGDALGAVDGAWAAGVFGVTEAGTFEHGLSTLRLTQDPDDPERWQRVRERLLVVRAGRPAPGRDDKVVTAWNGMAIEALARAGATLDEPAWITAAEEAATMVLASHGDVDGRLRRASRDGRTGGSAGVLSDYACLANGLLALAQATGEDAHVERAVALLDTAQDLFADGAGGYFDAAADTAPLVLRPRDATDGAEPSGWLEMARALVAVSALTGRPAPRARAEEALAVVAAPARRSPRLVGSGLSTAAALIAGPLEVAVVGEPGTAPLEGLRRVAFAATSPGAVVLVGDPRADPAPPLLRDRPMVDGRATAYVCRGFVCDAPTTSPADLALSVGAREGLVGE